MANSLTIKAAFAILRRAALSSRGLGQVVLSHQTGVQIPVALPLIIDTLYPLKINSQLVGKNSTREEEELGVVCNSLFRIVLYLEKKALD